ncbi:hypothetical protein BBJ28_00005449 [Nothophytophthora sp. Chile5]|nr:hypothetical protein BBJ28_00005449 [Nothophytophthora sp. Chile5]
MANAFAASLAAIRRNRADTVEEMSTSSSIMSPVASTPVNGKVRNRKRDSQLSAEGKEIWKKAMGDDAAQDTSVKTKTAPSTGRKGLFDDSSSEEEEDSDSGLFGVNGRNARATSRAPGASNGARSSDMSADNRPVAQNKNAHAMEASSGEDDSSDSDDDNGEHLALRFFLMLVYLYCCVCMVDAVSQTGTSFFAQAPKKEATSPKSSAPSSVGAGGSRPSVTVFFTSSAVRNEGKKSSGVFTFTLQFGNLEHSFSFTYTDFEEVHTRLASVFSAAALPKFPSKHRLRNNTKPENLQKRAQEFRLYLQQLVAVPGMLSSERFQFEYHIDGAFARALANGQTSSGNAGNGTQPSGRPPRSPATPPRKERATASPAHSQQKSPPARVTKPTKGGLFGSDDSDSDPESNSDTSVDTPKPMVRQQRRESAASTASRRKPKASQFSSSSIASAVPENSQRQKPSRARSRTSSRASSKASYKAAPRPAEPPRPAVTGLPPGRPNPFAGGRGDLLAAIRQGAQLKKTDGASDANSSGGGVSGGSSTGAKAPPHPPALTEPGSINEAITNAMAARRIHVEYEETNSNAESDSDDDWD